MESSIDGTTPMDAIDAVLGPGTAEVIERGRLAGGRAGAIRLAAMNRDDAGAGTHSELELTQLDRDCQAAAKHMEKFCARLRDGSLIATGYVEPVRPGEPPAKIAPESWDLLKLDLRSESAKGFGTSIVRIRIYSSENYRARANPSPEGPGETRTNALGNETPQNIDELDGRMFVDGPSFPGRPSVMWKIEKEMERRARVGDLAQSLAAESRALEDWADKTIHDFQTPKAKSISNAVREKYRRIVGRAPTRN